MKKLLLALTLYFIVGSAWAQNTTCATRPTGDATNACATTLFVQNTFNTNLSNITGDCSFTPTTITCTKTNGVLLGGLATQSGPTGVANNCLQANASGVISGIGAPCGTGSGSVTTVSNSDGTLTISPTTGSVVASLALAHANTWTATQTLNPSTSADALDITRTINGTAIYGLNESATSTGNLGAGFNYNLINITSDNAQCGSAAFCNGFTVQNTFGGSAMIGGRQAIQAAVNMTAASSASNSNRNYVAGTFLASASSTDNGTNNGAGALGALFALNPVAVLNAGGSNWLQVSGGEIDIGINPGGSARFQLGWTVAAGYNGLIGQAGQFNAGYNVSAITGGTLNAAYIISDINSAFPVMTTGTLQRAFILGATPTVANGTDWSAVTFTGCAFKDGNFCVGNGGTLTASLTSFVANPGATGSAVSVIQNTHATAGDWGLLIGVGPTGTADTSSVLILFENSTLPGVSIGDIARNGAAIVYNTTSDARRKTNIHDSVVGLEDLMKIKVKDFNFLEGPEGKVAPQVVNGFIAQELQPIYPDAVTVGGDDPWQHPWGVDYGRLTPLIVKSIQDMQHEIDDLRASRVRYN